VQPFFKSTPIDQYVSNFGDIACSTQWIAHSRQCRKQYQRRKRMSSKVRYFAVLVLLTLFLPVARAQEKTFFVRDGAFPWYDRVDKWALTDVPPGLEGTGPLPQANCTSRVLVVPDETAALMLGVAKIDLDKFKAKYPTASETGESIAVKNPQGARVDYRVLSFPKPPAQIGGGLSAGLLLLKLATSKPVPEIPDAKAPTTKAPTANTPQPRTGATTTGVTTIDGATTGGALPDTASPSATAPDANPLAVAKLPTKSSFDLYLLIGQSNMVGRDTTPIAQQITNPRVLAFDANGKWVVAKEPMHAGGTGIGPGIPFALELLRGDDRTIVGLIPCAVGGTPLSRWIKGGDLYEKAVQRARAAAVVGQIKGVLWHQGESDTSKKEDAETYQARLSQMFQDLRVDLHLPDVPIVVGQLGSFLTVVKYPYVETVRGALQAVSADVPHVGFADSADLKDKGDALHFSAEAQDIFATRYAAAMKTLQKAGNE
jgi:hypothetical protein